MEPRAVTLAEPHARGDRVGVVLQAAARGERDPDRQLFAQIEEHTITPEAVAQRLVAHEDPDQAG